MKRITTTAGEASVSSTTLDQGYLVTEPSAARIADIAAGQPYSFLSACLDIVDNSVENGARGVSVTFETVKKQIQRIVICDNGTGIASEIINEVLRAGSRTKHLYRPTSLSRYGIGLKGAGFSLAERITLLTRNESADFFRRAIDLRRIEETDQWQQEVWPATSDDVKFFETMLASLPNGSDSETGTVIVLERVKLRTRDLPKLKADLVRAAGETYSKFLGGSTDATYRRLAINVDGTEVEPVDPLHRENKETLLLIKREKIAFEDGSSAFFTAVALPHPQSQPPDVQRRYRYTVKTQGIYVYRNGRLVRSGETFDLFGKDFHLNSFRAEVEYSTEADVHFPVDVAKSTIRLDDDATQQLKPLVSAATRTANLLWREKDVASTDDIRDLFEETNRLIGSRANLLLEAVNKQKGQLKVPKRKLRTAVSAPSDPHPANSPAPTTAGTRSPSPSTSPTISPRGAIPFGSSHNEKKDPATTAAQALGDAPAPDALQPEVDTSSKASEGAYLRPVDNLPGGVLYRSRLDGEIGAVIVEVNLSHPFSKAVFEVSHTEIKSVPRRATTAVQQLLYILGYCEFTMVGEDENDDDARMFEQYRRYVSMNIDALLE